MNDKSADKQREQKPYPFRWIEYAAATLKKAAIAAGVPGSSLGKEIDDLLAGVPQPPVDLGFDSPADRAVRSSTTDTDRLDWLHGALFDKHWDGTIGRPCTWRMSGPYRHVLAKMVGNDFRTAIDAARSATEASKP